MRKKAIPEVLEQLWSAREVAQYLQVSQSWVYRAAEAGVLPHHRVGALVRFTRADIDAYLGRKGTS